MSHYSDDDPHHPYPHRGHHSSSGYGSGSYSGGGPSTRFDDSYEQRQYEYEQRQRYDSHTYRPPQNQPQLQPQHHHHHHHHQRNDHGLHQIGGSFENYHAPHGQYEQSLTLDDQAPGRIYDEQPMPWRENPEYERNFDRGIQRTDTERQNVLHSVILPCIFNTACDKKYNSNEKSRWERHIFSHFPKGYDFQKNMPSLWVCGFYYCQAQLEKFERKELWDDKLDHIFLHLSNGESFKDFKERRNIILRYKDLGLYDGDEDFGHNPSEQFRKRGESGMSGSRSSIPPAPVIDHVNPPYHDDSSRPRGLSRAHTLPTPTSSVMPPFPQNMPPPGHYPNDDIRHNYEYNPQSHAQHPQHPQHPQYPSQYPSQHPSQHHPQADPYKGRPSLPDPRYHGGSSY